MEKSPAQRFLQLRHACSACGDCILVLLVTDDSLEAGIMGMPMTPNTNCEH